MGAIGPTNTIGPIKPIVQEQVQLLHGTEYTTGPFKSSCVYHNSNKLIFYRYYIYFSYCRHYIYNMPYMHLGG